MREPALQSCTIPDKIADMFAVVEIAGKQYRVAINDVIDASYIGGKEGSTLTFDRVLLVSDGKKNRIGTPTVKGVAVKAKIVAQAKGEKLNVRRFKSKVRYRKSTGFRPLVTKLEILSIG
jgi:large subunit ribosomal protein L21